MELENERLQILKDAADHRRRDVMHYQINIDNYRLAIEEIMSNHADNEELVAFSYHLQGLLESSLLEQSKELIMLKVIEKQITESEKTM